MIDTQRIVSQALMLVTREPLMSLEDIRMVESPSARASLLFISIAIRTVLEAYDWTFALKRKKIQPSKIYTKDLDKYNGDQDLYTMVDLGWKAQYDLGQDFLGHLKIYNDDWSRIIQNRRQGLISPVWWLEGKRLCLNLDIYSNDYGLNIEYVYYNDKELCLPAQVEMCMVYYLAHLIAPKLIGSNEASKQWYHLYTLELTSAKVSDYNKRYRMAMDNSTGVSGK